MSEVLEKLAQFAPDAVLAAVLTESGIAIENVEFPLTGEVWAALQTRPGKILVYDLKKILRKLNSPDTDCTHFFDVKLAAMLENPAFDTGSIAEIAHAIVPDATGSEAELLHAIYTMLAPRWERAVLFAQIEMPLSRVLARMEARGIALDAEALRSFGEGLTERIEAAENAVKAAALCDFNLNSPKQLSELLFETLKLTPPGKKTKSGYSTDAETLEKLRDEHPMIAPLLEYRTLTKLQSTYVEGLLKAQKADGKLHTTFNMTATATGRLSSTDPNLQNIPVRSALGSEVRRTLVADPGEVLIDADYSQIELRILAHIADDPAMIAAFQNNEDIHAVTASRIFEVAPEEVTPELRRRAKAVNFGIVYGISAFALAEDLGMSRADAQKLIDSYFEKYSAVHEYLKRAVASAREKGYAETIFGRRRQLPELHSKIFSVRSFGERVALNMPIQGSAADLIKLAMVHTADALECAGLRAELVLQIHDELVVAAPEEEREAAAAILRNSMEHALSLKVPLSVSLESGYNYLELV